MTSSVRAAAPGEGLVADGPHALGQDDAGQRLVVGERRGADLDRARAHRVVGDAYSPPGRAGGAARRPPVRYRTLLLGRVHRVDRRHTVNVAIVRSLYRAVSPKEVTPAPMWNEARAVFSEKACSPTVVTESGRLTVGTAVRLNAKSPIVVRRSQLGTEVDSILGARWTQTRCRPGEIAPPRSMLSSLPAEQKAQVPTVSKLLGQGQRGERGEAERLVPDRAQDCRAAPRW